MENIVHTDELCHAGRKGMRWGQHIFCGPNCDKHGSKGKKGKKQEEETTEAPAKQPDLKLVSNN